MLSLAILYGDDTPGEDVKHARSTNNNDGETRLRNFREMMIMILSCSKRIAIIDILQRRLLESKIQLASSIDEIKNIVMDSFLSTISIIFNDMDECKNTKDMIRKGRFDLLLLCESFDCDERKMNLTNERKMNLTNIFPGKNEEEMPKEEDEEDECSICLDGIDQSECVLLECSREFCTACINTWMSHSSTCPACCTPFGLSQRVAIRNPSSSTAYTAITTIPLAIPIATSSEPSNRHSNVLVFLGPSGLRTYIHPV